MSEKHSPRDAYVAAVDALGDVWTFLITREAFFGACRFQDFCNTLNISRARLSERLKHLVDAGIFEKRQYNAAPPRFEYRFTKKGRAIYPMALTLISWGETWRSEPGASNLIHRPCGCQLSVKTTCASCGERVRREDVKWPLILPLDASLSDNGSVRGWRKMASFESISDRPDPAVDALRAVGDRWSLLLLYGALHTDFRFRQAQAKIGLAHNVLTDRLKHLVAEGVLERQEDGRSAPYKATDAGCDMIDTILAMRSWALDWAPTFDRPWGKLIHKTCGADIRVICRCAHCDREIKPRDVAY